MKTKKYSSKFNFPKILETIRTSGFDEWRTLEIEPDGMESIKFYISDSGDVFVEFAAYHSMTLKNKDFHITLSELKEIIKEVEQIASVTFDGDGGEKYESGEE